MNGKAGSTAPSVAPMPAWMTRSASSSISVGSRLTMTSAAPFCFARSGKSAAGNTDSDEPSTMNRSHAIVSSCARCIGSSGIG